jgi:hypothetical protein
MIYNTPVNIGAKDRKGCKAGYQGQPIFRVLPKIDRACCVVYIASYA